MRIRLTFNGMREKTPTLVCLSLGIGIGAGLGAYGFRWLIGFVQDAFWHHGASLLAWPAVSTVLIPAAGGALVGPLVYFLARETKGHGVPEVMLAVAQEQGRMRFRVVFVKALASALCIGTGGSAGREGPIVQIGSALGSGLGQLTKVPVEILRTLVAAGAAGGISATFNAPIAGVFFSLEVILRDFSSRAFSLVVLASVTATVISRALLGQNPAFFVPPYELRSPWELIFYTALGLLAALVARAFTWSLYRFEDVFDAWQFPEYLKPVAGGLCVGALSLAFPQVLGVGYETLEVALRGHLAPVLMGGLLVAKIAATSLTLGSGGSGGVFAPSLFMGAMLGGGLGSFFHALFPAVTAPSGAYALVGMAAVFAGAAQTPITSVLILFEMTGDYRIILPLMTAVGISSLVSHFLGRETIYTIKLRRRGIDILAPPRPDPLAQIRVADVMVRQVVTLRAALPLPAILEHLRQHPFSSFPVTDGNNALVGILGYSELREVLTSERPEGALSARDLMRSPPPVSYPDETLTEVMEKFRLTGAGRLPVVSREQPTILLGVISHSDLLTAYQRAAVDRHLGG
ncbi:MAG TPA: chloride channel protein [Candidatus Methylomirabilis sp.]|nr:chloride channel protein [Candidatus Methylomirabilis sp.]